MQNTSTSTEALRDEISRMLARGIIVVNRTQALTLAESLNTVIVSGEFGCWYVAEVSAIDRETSFVILSLEELERILDEILDFNDRINAEIIAQDSIHLINVNAECDISVGGYDITLALIGDWEPEITVAMPLSLAGYSFDIPEIEDAECGHGREKFYHLTEAGKALIYGEQHRYGGEYSESGEALSSHSVDNDTGIHFLVNAENVDITAESGLLPFPLSEVYSNVMMGLKRPISRWLPDEESLREIKILRETLPHLGEFFDEVIIAMELATRFKANRFTLPPMILNGPSGVGKTHGLYQLAKVLGISMQSIPMATTDGGFALIGSERGWKDPVPGLLAKSAAKSHHINPVFILDEFEKSNFRRDYGVNGTEPAVLQMLERDSAARFRDGFLEQEINLSEISYIGSSNTIDQIPAPILSRVKVIEVGYPPAQALQGIYTAILNKSLRDDFGIEGITVTVGHDIREAVKFGITPRAIRNNAGKILSVALGNAKDGDCIEIPGNDLIALIQNASRYKKISGIGFLAQL